MKRIIALTGLLALTALGMACGGNEANNANANANRANANAINAVNSALANAQNQISNAQSQMANVNKEVNKEVSNAIHNANSNMKTNSTRCSRTQCCTGFSIAARWWPVSRGR